MFRKQRGVALKGLIFWGIVIALVAITGMKVVPAVIEYNNILKDVRRIAVSSSADTTVGDIRRAFDKQADIDFISTIRGEDLDVTKESGSIVINFAYSKKIPVGWNVSLVIDFQGSSRN